MSPDVPEKLDLETINPMLEAAGPVKIVEWAAAQFGRNLIMSSSFGAESALLIHMATRVLPNIRIVMVDTGYLFPETHRFMEELRLRFDLNVWIYRTKSDPIAYLQQTGEDNPTWRKNIEGCCAVNKNEPFDRAFAELKPLAYLRGIRANQTDMRKKTLTVEWAKRYGCYAISPLLSWSSREIYSYMKQHYLPYHPLYEKGYASIGCNPLSCTRPIQPGEDPRSGRWSGTGKVECGINLTNLSDAIKP
jgi:phosphoadenosine phosphosulfate reductase